MALSLKDKVIFYLFDNIAKNKIMEEKSTELAAYILGKQASPALCKAWLDMMNENKDIESTKEESNLLLLLLFEISGIFLLLLLQIFSLHLNDRLRWFSSYR